MLKNLFAMMSATVFCDQVRAMLNDPDPEEYLEATRRRADPQDPWQRRRFEALQKILDEAHTYQVPLGVDPGEHSSLENAYLYRQRHIESICQRIEFKHTAIMLIAMLAFGIVIMLSTMLL